jgi:transcription initiation factor TFIIIB Brf1 subunit/transcription initiation factor TFIIB
LAIALYLTSSEIPENVYKQLKIKSARVLYLRNIIRTLDSPHEDNELESTFNFIGRSADVPDAIVQRAYSAYLEENPYNSIDSESVRVAAWIYMYCRRINFKGVTKKSFYSNISGVSRISFGRALDSYQDQRHNSHIAK